METDSDYRDMDTSDPFVDYTVDLFCENCDHNATSGSTEVFSGSNVINHFIPGMFISLVGLR